MKARYWASSYYFDLANNVYRYMYTDNGSFLPMEMLIKTYEAGYKQALKDMIERIDKELGFKSCGCKKCMEIIVEDLEK